MWKCEGRKKRVGKVITDVTLFLTIVFKNILHVVFTSKSSNAIDETS